MLLLCSCSVCQIELLSVHRLEPAHKLTGLSNEKGAKLHCSADSSSHLFTGNLCYLTRHTVWNHPVESVALVLPGAALSGPVMVNLVLFDEG